MLNRALPKVVSALWDHLSFPLLVTTTTTVHFLLSFFLPLDSPHFYTFTVHTRHTPQWHTLSDNYYLVQPPQSQFLLLVVFSAILFSSVQSSPPLNEDYSGNPLLEVVLWVPRSLTFFWLIKNQLILFLNTSPASDTSYPHLLLLITYLLLLLPVLLLYYDIITFSCYLLSYFATTTTSNLPSFLPSFLVNPILLFPLAT